MARSQTFFVRRESLSKRHHATIPFRRKKCALHPAVRQTDGDRVGKPSHVTRNRHEGESVGMRLS